MWRPTLLVFFLAGWSLSPARSQAQPAEFLLVDQPTPLLQASQGYLKARTVLEKKTLLRVVRVPEPEGMVVSAYYYPVMTVEDGGEWVGWVDRRKCINLATLARCYPLQFRSPPFPDGHIVFEESDFAKVPAIVLYAAKQLEKKWRQRYMDDPKTFEESWGLAEAKSQKFVKDWLDLQGKLQDVVKGNSPEAMREVLPDIYFARASMWQVAYVYDEALRDYLAAASLVGTSKRDLVKYSKEFVRMKEVMDRQYLFPAPPRQIAAAPNYYGAGYHAFWRGDFKAALRNFSDAVDLAPREPLYWYYRALTYKKLGDERNAVHDVRIGADLESEEA